MIKEFKECPMEKTGIVYQSLFEQIKMLYNNGEEELAKELAVSAIELSLTGQISSDDFMVQALLQNIGYVMKSTIDKKANHRESKEERQVEALKLKEIATMVNSGMTQKDIGAKFGVSQQTIAKRMLIIREKYPEWLKESASSKNLQPKLSENTTKKVVLQPNQQDTTKNENLTTNLVVKQKKIKYDF